MVTGSTPDPRAGFRYQPFWCEENAWWLCAEPALGPGERHVVLVTSLAGRVPLLEQRAVPLGKLVGWDYHVVVVDGQGRVWDLDTRLPLPVSGLRWLDRSFALALRLSAIYAPRLRCIPAEEFRRGFASDRSHMRDRRGRWLRPPPPWSPIGQGMSLPRLLDPRAAAPGRLLDLDAARRWLAELGCARHCENDNESQGQGVSRYQSP